VLGDSLRGELLFVQAARRLEVAGAVGGAQLRQDLAKLLDAAARAPSGDAGAVSGPDEVAPLPLTPGLWASAVFRQPVAEDALARAVLTDRRALLLAHGLAGLDPETLAWVAARPALLAFLYGERAPVFAAFGRSLRVVDGRLALPGGAEAREAWTDLAGTDPADAERFTRALLSRDEGRLAWLYDTVAHLDPAQARHALGVSAADPRAGRDRARRLARVFVSAGRGEWRTAEAPFGRPRVDPAWLLRELSVEPDGSLAGPRTQSFWDRAFDRPAPAGTTPRGTGVPIGGETDVADLAQRVFAEGTWSARARFVAVLFAQRAFPRPGARDEADVLAAVQGMTTFPAVLLTVERLGSADPGLYAAVAREAATVDAIADAGRRTRALLGFQGALAVVDRLAASGSVDAGTAQDLVGALCTPSLSAARAGGAATVRWVRNALLPALALAPVTGGTGDSQIEQQLLQALAGASGTAGGALVIEWEGQRHAVDLARGRLRRLQRVRTAQGTPAIDVALRLLRASEAAEAAASAPAAADGGAGLSDDDLDALPGEVLSGLGVEADAPRAIRRAREALAAATPGERAGRARVLSQALATLADAVVADALRALAYANAVAPSEDAGLHTGDLARRHDFGFDLAPPPVRERAPWALPRITLGGDKPWRLSGALLGLELPLAVERLPRVESDAPPRRQRLDDMVRLVLAQHALVPASGPAGESDATAIAAALERGAGRIAAVAEGRESIDGVVRDAGLSEWRREALRWLVRHAPDRLPRVFSLGERLRLGNAAADTAVSWPLAAETLTGSLALRAPGRGAWEDLAGHAGTGMVAADFDDVPLRLAGLLARTSGWGALLPALVPFATWDTALAARAAHADDWFALVDAVSHLDAARLDDYLAVLAGDGSLEPVAGTGGLQ
jgi:hypothetical protein